MNRVFQVLTVIVVILSASAGVRAEHKASFCTGDYYSPDERYRAYEELAAKTPDLVSIERIGSSVEGKPIVAIKIALRDGVTRPEALITGNIHGNEFLGGRMAFEDALRLVSGYKAKDPWIMSLLSRTDFYIVPMVNPDGYSIAYKHLKQGFTARRKNADRVDLNRNFPYPSSAKSRGIMSGSGFKYHPNYRGKGPLSEPEPAALIAFVEKHHFFVAINFHTTGGMFLYPYGFSKEKPADLKTYQEMGKVFNDHQAKTKYKVRQARGWYQTVGDLDDWLYKRFGILSVTVELAKYDKRLLNPVRGYNLFWWYNPVNIQAWVNNDRDASLYAIEKALELTGGRPRPQQPIEWKLPSKN